MVPERRPFLRHLLVSVILSKISSFGFDLPTPTNDSTKKSSSSFWQSQSYSRSSQISLLISIAWLQEVIFCAMSKMFAIIFCDACFNPLRLPRHKLSCNRCKAMSRRLRFHSFYRDHLEYFPQWFRIACRNILSKQQHFEVLYKKNKNFSFYVHVCHSSCPLPDFLAQIRTWLQDQDATAPRDSVQLQT